MGVGIGVHNVDILPKKSQISDFLGMIQSERFTGFSGEGNG
jgi:hypothetical protein